MILICLLVTDFAAGIFGEGNFILYHIKIPHWYSSNFMCCRVFLTSKAHDKGLKCNGWSMQFLWGICLELANVSCVI